MSARLILKGLLVAVKYIYKKDQAKDTTHYEETFKKEIAMLSSLRHPNIINFIGWSRVRDDNECDRGDEPEKDSVIDLTKGRDSLSSLVMVTEYMGGGTLDQMIKQSYSFLSNNFVVIHNIATDVLCGMTYLHERYILHRQSFFLHFLY